MTSDENLTVPGMVSGQSIDKLRGTPFDTVRIVLIQLEGEE